MLVLIQSKINGKWSVHSSSISLRGISAERVVWVDPPDTDDDEEVVAACGGEHYSLDEVLESAKWRDEASETILRALASRPRTEWVGQISSLVGTDPDLQKRIFALVEEYEKEAKREQSN